MKLAWICYDEYGDTMILFEEPEDCYFGKIIPIVYSEIEE